MITRKQKYYNYDTVRSSLYILVLHFITLLLIVDSRIKLELVLFGKVVYR